uniref:Uncharacterized protein n=1 Tax=Pinguiococcus pyrenoidosus TaxID=172671 RepID=A0A7R9U1D4_9STRA|mmetsp:Transcript_11100/g.41457  ORF Transcript_11100/g.41457 Transcript_11100/m.41457 type:complete len:260 (+) Transcript_11100:315-1094(+)
MSEPRWYCIAPYAAKLLIFLANLGTGLEHSVGLPRPLRTFFAWCHTVQTTPTFDIPDHAPELLRKRGVGLGLAWGLLDIVHTPQIQKWAGRRRVLRLSLRREPHRYENGGKQSYARPRPEASDVAWAWLSFWRMHETMCVFLPSAHLERYPELWGLKTTDEQEQSKIDDGARGRDAALRQHEQRDDPRSVDGLGSRIRECRDLLIFFTFVAAFVTTIGAAGRSAQASDFVITTVFPFSNCLVKEIRLPRGCVPLSKVPM